MAHQQFQPQAIVGLACRFPGADNADEFWELLRDGRSGIGEMPPDRLNQRLYYDSQRGTIGKSYSRIAGVVPFRPVDRSLCPISDEQLAESDPTHLAMCEVACAAVHDAGYETAGLAGRNIGVYIGNSSASNLEADLVWNSHADDVADFVRNAATAGGLDEGTATEAANDVASTIRREFPAWNNSSIHDVTSGAAARLIAQTLKLTGPHVAIDAACASSFVALHQAALAIHAGRIDAAIVGAFSFRNWYEMVVLSATQTVSPSGSRPFSADADGMVPADGYAAIIVKPLNHAIADGDRIHGVVRSMGVSSDGRGKSFWAPRQAGQVAAIQRAYAHGDDPAKLQFIEAHATSTQIGDPTELNSLLEAVGSVVAGKIPVSSVKANIGHTLEVAGFASLIKTLLAMRHGALPPAINCEPLNPKIDWDGLPFYVTAELSEWPEPRGGLRTAAIDSFGIGGLNVHLVVEQGPAQPLAGAENAISPTASPAESCEELEPIAVVGLSAPVVEASLAGEFLQLAGIDSAPGALSPADYEFDWKKHRIPPKQVAGANPLQFLILDATVRALEEGGHLKKDFDRTRAAAVVGGIFTCDFLYDAFIGVRLPELKEQATRLFQSRNVSNEQIARINGILEETLIQQKPAARDTTVSATASTLASMIAKHLDLMGGAFSVDAGEQSPQAALTAAVNLLQSGTCDMVLCAVGQSISDTAFQEAQAAGRSITLGTGAAALVLKRLCDAERDGDAVHSVLPGKVARPVSTAQSAAHSADNLDGIATVIIDLITEQTGFPRKMITRNAHLRDDLNLDEAAVNQLLRELGTRIGLAEVVTELPEECQTLDEFAKHAAGMLSATTTPETDGMPSATTVTPCVLRTIETRRTTKPDDVPSFAGPAIILGDNAAAEALRSKLKELDLAVHQFAADADINNLLQQIDACWAAQPAPHLFVMTGRDENTDANLDAMQLLRDALICQRWLAHVTQANLLDRASLVAVTSLGGDFGFSGRIRNLNGAGISGLLKSIAAETQGRLNVRVIDAPENEPPKMIAATVLRELLLRDGDVETAIVRGKPHAVRIIPDEISDDPPAEVRRGAVWVVGGEISETTASVLREFGRRCGVKLHLLSAQSVPNVDESQRNLNDDQLKELRWQIMRDARAAGEMPLEVWNRKERELQADALLQSLADAGIAATWHQCDIANRDELQRHLQTIRQTDGAIEGVLHIPEMDHAGRFEKTTSEDIARALNANVVGPALLMEATASDPLRHFVVLCAGRGRFGRGLQAEASMAEETLAKLTATFAQRQTGCAAKTLHVPALSASDGARLATQVVDAMLAAASETELLLLTETETGQGADAVLSPTVLQDHNQRQSRVADAPMIDRMFPGEMAHGVAEILFDPARDPFLVGHLHEGTPLLPAVIGIESCAEAASVWCDGRVVVAMHDQQILNGFRMAGQFPHRARVNVTVDGNMAACALTGEFFDKTGRLTDPNRVYQTCQMELADAPRPVAVPQLGPVPDEWITVPYPEDWRDMGADESGTVFYGPELRTLRQVHHLPEGSWGRMLAPSVSELGGLRRGDRWHTPPAMLDGALFLCDLYATSTLQTRQLPHVIERIDFGRIPQPGEQCLAWCVYRGREKRRVTWDFWILGEDGTVILACEGFHGVIVEEMSPTTTMA